MKRTTVNVHTNIVHQHECLVRTDGMGKCTCLICRCGLFGSYRYDLVRHKLSVVIQPHAEEVRILVRGHICVGRIQFGICDIVRMLLIEGHSDVMVHAVIRVFDERGRHEIIIAVLRDLRGCRIQVLCQVAALGTADRIFIILDNTVCRALGDRCQYVF